MLLHAFRSVEAFVAHWAIGDAAAVVNSSNVLIQMSLGSKKFAALLAFVISFFHHEITLVIAMHPLHMQRQRSVGIDVLLANIAAVRRYPQMPPHVLHEQAHVLEVLVTHAALQFGELIFRFRNIYVLEHFTFLLEQNVMNGAGDLAIVDQGVSLHVLSAFELHVTFGAVDSWRTGATLLHVGFK